MLVIEDLIVYAGKISEENKLRANKNVISHPDTGFISAPYP